MPSFKLSTILISSLPGLQMIGMSFLFQIMQTFCVDTTKSLEQLFGYDFNIPPAMDTVLIWKISGYHHSFTPLQYMGENIQFSSEETYLLLAHKSSSTYTVHYWLGKNTLLIDKQVVAIYAILLSQYNFRWTSIAREIEGMESDSFQHRMKMFKKQARPQKPYDFFITYLNDCFPFPRPNLYVAREYGHIHMKKIPLSLGPHWLKNADSCLVLELEYKVENMLPINYLCGSRANEKLIEASENVIDHFYGYLNPEESCTNSVDNNRHSNDFKQFLEVLEDSSFYNPFEIDHSSDHLKNSEEFIRSREEEISMFDVTSDGLRKKQRRLESSLFQEPSMGYIIDTKSVAGIFLIFLVSTNLEEMVTAVQQAEAYLEDTYPISSGKIVQMRIVDTFLDYSSNVDLKIYLSDFWSPIGEEDDNNLLE